MATCPETIEVKGHSLEIEYHYRAADQNARFEIDRQDKFVAWITIPSDIVLELQTADFPTLGRAGRPEIVYRCVVDSFSISIINSDFDALKAEVKKNLREVAKRKSASPPSPPGYLEGSDGGQQSVGAGRLNFILRKLIGEPEEVKPAEAEKSAPVVREVPKPVEKEKMTEELRAELGRELATARFFLETVRAVPEPDKKADNADKISKIRARAADLKRALNAVERELAASADADRARGQVRDIVKKSEKTAADLARLQKVREDWPDNFQKFMAKLLAAAKDLGEEIKDSAMADIRVKLTALARRRGEVADLDGEIETILLDSI
jgi:hypothetical protein